MAATSSPSSSSSSSLTPNALLESRFAEWEAKLKDVTNPGYASSEESLVTRNIKVLIIHGQIYYREHNGQLVRLKRMDDIPGKSMHLHRPHRAQYAGANCLELARVEALTQAIYSGTIKITGQYACVNHIGTYPSNGAPELIADTPVPIRLQLGQDVEAMTGYHEVIVAKKVRRKIHVAHIKPEYSSSDNARPLNSQRIYFAGASPKSSNSLEVASEHYRTRLVQVHLGSSGKVKTEKADVTILGLTSGLITTLYSDYKDGLLLEYSTGFFHTIETLDSIYSHPIESHLVWESDSDGRHIKIFSSEEEVEVIWQYDTTIWLSDRQFALDRCLDDSMIQKAARQFKNLTLESYATMLGANTLDIVAAYQRRWNCDERSVSGDACYLFQGDGKLAKDCIRASPMRREQLEGVALVATPHGDYSLRTGAKVMYSRGEGGVWHIDSNGDTASVPHSDLVGAEIL